MYLALQRNCSRQRPEFQGVIADHIRRASSAKVLEGLALGAFTAENSDLLAIVDQKRIALADSSSTGAYIDKLIASTGCFMTTLHRSSR